ncbi:3-dehydroquinate dehydratase [Enterococcus florum]|uniref:3-dehydroquinate dehydratase n=1 Tax=Enterococcus florum TaxID=2480627 RepID=A0A4P5PDN2_9ENTE|nr:type I 3-dehydroquinate dehydratase [Enterococcus florum]GCF93682.1 3-dehydroquinate dehydratase [Enterococcus florum]
METVTVENVTLGEGLPKVIVPLVGKTRDEILQEAEIAVSSNCDIIEWRIDHFEEVTDFAKAAEFTKEVKEAVKMPLLVTFRTAKEGGVCPMDDAQYFEMYHAFLEQGSFDLLDVELFMPETEVDELVKAAHDKGVKIVMCNHDFDKTPPKEEIITRLRAMQDKGADICKIAVMPQTTHDVIVLLDATQEMYNNYAKQPLITMSMGKLGVVSRVSGATFGSAATFGAAKKASAPGQVSVGELRTILETL